MARGNNSNNNGNNNDHREESLYSYYKNLLTDFIFNRVNAVRGNITTVQNSFFEYLDSFIPLCVRAAQFFALFLAVTAALTLLSWLMICIASVSATTSAMTVRMWSLWGVPQDAEIPIPFDFSHRNQRCPTRRISTNNNNNNNNNNDYEDQRHCAIATSTLHVQCLMNFTKPVRVDSGSYYSSLASSSSSWFSLWFVPRFMMPQFLLSPSSSSTSNNDGDKEDDDEYRRSSSSSSFIDHYDTELVPFLEPAYDFVAGAKYSLSVEYYVPASAVCHGMITTQVEIHTVKMRRKKIDSMSTIYEEEDEELVEYEMERSSEDIDRRRVLKTKAETVKRAAQSSKKGAKSEKNANEERTKKRSERRALDEDEANDENNNAHHHQTSSRPLFTAAASSAVVTESGIHSHQNYDDDDDHQEFWLTKLCRNLLFLPIQIFIPRFGAQGLFSSSIFSAFSSAVTSSSRARRQQFYDDSLKTNQNLLNFDLVTRFSPPRRIASLIKYLNFSIFTQNEHGACCRPPPSYHRDDDSSSSSNNNNNNKRGNSNRASSSPSRHANCLRIFEPVLKIRVELDSLMARLHQNYPVACFLAVFVPVWIFAFCSTGAVIIGSVLLAYHLRTR